MHSVEKINIRRDCSIRGTLIESWAIINQSVIALLSGEAEYCRLVIKGASVALEIRAICKDMGVELEKPIESKSDASAAIGINNR